MTKIPYMELFPGNFVNVFFSVIGKYVRQAQGKLRIRKSHAEKSLMVEDSSPVLEKLLVNEGIHPDDICTLLMDMIILGVQAVIIDSITAVTIMYNEI